jgi:hypothetical protein
MGVRRRLAVGSAVISLASPEDLDMPKPNDDRPRGRPSDEDIAKRAYELYLQRGSLPGYEVDDWLQAEAELTVSAARGVDQEQAEETTTSDPRGTAGKRSGRRDATSPTRRTLRQ